MANNFVYNNNVPAGPDDPADDQPKMLVNTQSIQSWTDIDHVGYNIQNSGIHKHVTLRNMSAPGLGDGQGVLYGHSAGGQSFPFWQNALGSYQLVGLSSFTTNGYAILGGGLIIKWGKFDPNASINVAFNTTVPFTNILSIQLTGSADNNSTFRNNISTGSLTTLGFTWEGSVNTHYTPIYYLAIGN